MHYYSFQINVPLQKPVQNLKVRAKCHFIHHNFDNVIYCLKSDRVHNWHKSPLEQQQLFVYIVAIVDIVFVATEQGPDN